jgi:hypothetical protein
MLLVPHRYIGWRGIWKFPAGQRRGVDHEAMQADPSTKRQELKAVNLVDTSNDLSLAEFERDWVTNVSSTGTILIK